MLRRRVVSCTHIARLLSTDVLLLHSNFLYSLETSLRVLVVSSTDPFFRTSAGRTGL